jgi:hypothetical protein
MSIGPLMKPPEQRLKVLRPQRLLGAGSARLPQLLYVQAKEHVQPAYYHEAGDPHPTPTARAP